MKRLIAVGMLLIGVFIGSPAQKRGGENRGAENKSSEGISRAPFRYIVVAGVSTIERKVNNNPHYYALDVLMEDQAFNEANLRVLFRLLSKRFNDRAALFVDVYTSLEAIRTPEEYDEVDLVGPVGDYYKYKYAFFSRNRNGERFQWGIPNQAPPSEVIITPPPTERPLQKSKSS
jgi:hypothetical protein